MDFFSLLILLVRRWFVVLPVLLVALLIGLTFIGSPDVRYTARGSELLTVRSQSEAGSQSSLAVDPTIAAAVLRNALLQPSVTAELAEQGLSSSFTASVDPTRSILTLNVSGPGPQDVVDTSAVLLDLAPSILATAVGEDFAESLVLSRFGTPSESDVIEVDGQYVVSSYIALAPTPEASNPYGPDNATAQLLVELSRNPALLQSVREVVPTAEFVVGSDRRVDAPLLIIDSTAEDPVDVSLVYDLVVAQLEDGLVELQEGARVTSADQTVLLPLVAPGLVERASSSVVRAVAGVAVLGIAAATMMAIGVDGALERRRRRYEQPDPSS